MTEALQFKIIEDVASLAAKSLTGTFSVVGVHSAQALAAPLSNSMLSAKHPQLVVVESVDQARVLAEEIAFFSTDAQIFILPEFDVDLYSNLYPNQKIIAERLRWLYHAQNAKAGQIFIASQLGLLQKTLPIAVFNENTLLLEKGESLPAQFSELLARLGYVSVPLVEDPGTYCIKGGVIDIFSPASNFPARIDLFADEIEKIKQFDPETQRSLHDIEMLAILPAREVIYLDENRQATATRMRDSFAERSLQTSETDEIINQLAKGQSFHGIDFLLPFFYENCPLPHEYFSESLIVWLADPTSILREQELFFAHLKEQFLSSTDLLLRVPYQQIYHCPADEEILPVDLANKNLVLKCEKIAIENQPEEERHQLEFNTHSLIDFKKNCAEHAGKPEALAGYIRQKFSNWRAEGYSIFVASSFTQSIDRIKHLLESCDCKTEVVAEDSFLWDTWLGQQRQDQSLLHFISRDLNYSLRFADDKLILLKDSDFITVQKQKRRVKKSGNDTRRQFFSFSDLSAGDLVVHKMHGVGVYEGLKVMPIAGIATEFVQLQYKDNDRLYLPVYRINQLQKFSGPQSNRLLDKIGGTGWEKTKTKVKKQLRDITTELLALYAKRSQASRPAFASADEDYQKFSEAFQYKETEDQESAIADVLKDLTSNKPMDRLICGDVGFGKTEVAMRAAFKAVQEGFQVAVIAPTTILTFQHAESFKRRFRDWPTNIKALNRFVSAADVKKTLAELEAGTVDIVIGTHRLLSKDIKFKKLGLLVIDEEQKFGAKHKEKIRQMSVEIDTLTLSATPIPRTLNMSFVGIKDLSIINTPPQDRLPTRTFVCKYDTEVFRKGITSEISRGGQVFFLHNRVQSIEGIAADIRSVVPQARIAIGHGQMDEDRLEKTILAFFNKEIDVLVCTTIIESGMDIPNANTMFIDNAQALGLSQLYQLRGRVGRSKERAYCYLVVPPKKPIEKEAQERLRILQENTALGSGIKIAQYDLELRGAGDLLGQEQSGHINAVGYEMYMELLEDCINEQKGVALDEDLDPEINLRVQALIPDKYIPDIRIRLNYYKLLSSISAEEDINTFEDELRDQFGKLPEPVMNLMGVMLIKKVCRDLKIKDLTQSNVGISLTFTDKTPLSAKEVLKLSQRENKKFSLAPDNRFIIRINNLTWTRVYEELIALYKFCE